MYKNANKAQFVPLAFRRLFLGHCIPLICPFPKHLRNPLRSNILVLCICQYRISICPIPQQWSLACICV